MFERLFVLQGYRVAVQRLQLEFGGDHLIIRGGRTGQPEFRFPKQLDANRLPINLQELLAMSSNGVGDVLEFSDPSIIITVYTDHSVTLAGFELAISPSASKNTDSLS